MATKSRLFVCLVCALTALLLGAVQMGYELSTGGVQSHHLLNRADLPAISNWYGLIVLPVLGWLYGARLHNLWPNSSRVMWLGLFGALIYGSAFALSFELDLSEFTSMLFIGLFVLAFILPLYRIEYILGFVASMALTFGAVLPLLFGSVLAVIAFLVRFIGRHLLTLFRRLRNSSDAV
jgi:hypothetical protein